MRCSRSVLMAFALLLGAHGAWAQDASPSPAAAPSQQMLDAGQLDQPVAPIALYPDTLLAQVQPRRHGVRKGPRT
jgi:hypothetical protein